MIALENISKKFGDREVFNDFSIIFPDASKTAVMGKSGCGKSTLLNLIMGFETPDKGKVIISPGKKISVVFQEDRLCETLSIYNNIRLVCSCGKKQVYEHMRRLGLEEKTPDSIVSELSGGEKRRVSIMRSMMYGGEIFLLDEPFKGLDTLTRQTAAEYITENTASALVIAVTHDKHEAELLGAETVNICETN